MQNGDSIHPSSISSFITATDASGPLPKLCPLDVSKREWFNRTYPDKSLDVIPDLIEVPPLSPLPERPPFDTTWNPFRDDPVGAAESEARADARYES